MTFRLPIDLRSGLYLLLAPSPIRDALLAWAITARRFTLVAIVFVAVVQPAVTKVSAGFPFAVSLHSLSPLPLE